MGTRRRVLLIVLIVVVFIIGGWNLNKQDLIQENSTEYLSADELERINKEFELLNKELERLKAQADTTIKDLQRLPQPTTGVERSYPDGEHENAWIQDVDEKEGLVLVTTVDSKISIVFKPTAYLLQNFSFNVGWIVPVTFQCSKKNKDKCDFDSPYKLFVLNSPVEVEQLKFPKK